MNHPLSSARRGSGDGDDAHALTGPYAVDALDADERALVERHLETCPACRDEVRELRETAARLAASTAVPPPDRLRSRVMAEIGTVRQAPPRNVVPLSRRGTLRGARLPWLAAAAMFVATVVLGTLLADARGEGGGDSRADRIAAIVTAPDTRTVTTTAGGVGGTVLTSRSRNEMLVLTSGLPAADAEHRYQVWFMTDRGVRSAGLLDDSAGQGANGQLLAPGLGDAARIGVTLEPAGGSPAPTTPPVVMMTLPV